MVSKQRWGLGGVPISLPIGPWAVYTPLFPLRQTKQDETGITPGAELKKIRAEGCIALDTKSLLGELAKQQGMRTVLGWG